MPMFADTPKPPYYAVIFTSFRTEGDNGYGAMAEKMNRLAAEQCGFLGVESARDDVGITSYWSDIESIKNWKTNIDHLEAQELGREKLYSSLKVRVSNVEREYGIQQIATVALRANTHDHTSRHCAQSLCVQGNSPMNATLKFIGHINTPFESVEDCPNNVDPNGPLCQLVLDEEFRNGLSGLHPGQKILILYWFENTDRNAIEQAAGNGDRSMGTFALRSPHRPNPIGAATLPIEAIDNEIVSVRGLDCLNRTRLLDIKPAILLENSNENT